jgi:hypothetical protein
VRTDVLLGLTVGGVIALGVVASWVGGAQQTSARDTRTSTLIPGPEGSQALHETLAELGIAVQRRRTALFDLSERGAAVGALVVLAPPVELLTDELAEVVRFVRDGGGVVAAGDGGGITACAGFVAPRADSGWVMDGAMPADFGRPTRVRGPDAAQRLPPARRVLEPLEVPERFQGPNRRRRPEDAGCALLVPRATDTLLATVDGRPVILRLGFERDGHLLLVADPVYFRNRAWRETDAAYFMIPLLVPQRRGPLVWDEYHQGFGGAVRGADDVLWEWLWRSPVGWAILQLAAVALVWLAVRAVRFGPARSVIERRRRSPLEHVEALAAGLEGARGADTAIELIITGLRRRLSRGGILGAGDVASWLAALELALPTAQGRAAARRLQRLRTEPGSGERVLAAAQAVEDVWQDLRPRSTQPAS